MEKLKNGRNESSTKIDLVKDAGKNGNSNSISAIKENYGALS